MAVKVSRRMLPSLVERLVSFFPLSLPVHGSLVAIHHCEADDSQIWVDAWPEVTAVLICPSLTRPRVPVIDYEVKIFALTEESFRLILKTRKLLDDRPRTDFCATREIMWPAIRDFAKSAGYKAEIAKGIFLMMYLPDSVELSDSLEIPEGLTVRSLHPSHSPHIATVWDYGPPIHKEHYLAALISSFPSAAVYDQHTTDLLAWVLCYEDGAMAHLYVSPSVCRRGLASLLVTRLAATLRNQGRTPYTYIHPGNKPSYQLHAKLGFVVFQERLSWASCVKQT